MYPFEKCSCVLFYSIPPKATPKRARGTAPTSLSGASPCTAPGGPSSSTRRISLAPLLRTEKLPELLNQSSTTFKAQCTEFLAAGEHRNVYKGQVYKPCCCCLRVAIHTWTHLAGTQAPRPGVSCHGSLPRSMEYAARPSETTHCTRAIHSRLYTELDPPP